MDAGPVMGLASIVLAIVVVGFIASSGAIAQTEFSDDLITGAAGCNSTVTTNCGFAYNITINALEGTDNATGFLDTTGTIAAVVVLLGVVIGGFALFRMNA